MSADRPGKRAPRPGGRPPFVVDVGLLLQRLWAPVRRLLIVLAVLVKRFWRPGASFLLRVGPPVLLLLIVVYAVLVLRAAVNLRSLLWVGNGVFTLTLAGLGVHRLVGSLERHGLGLAARDLADELGDTAPEELWVIAPDGTRRASHTLDRRMYLVGRGPVCDIRIEEETVSRRHCRIVLRSGVYRVEDLDSTYGTQLNGRRLPPEGAVLKRGDVIGFSATGAAATTLYLGPPPDPRKAPGAPGTTGADA